MPQLFRGKSLLIPLVISGLGVMTVASAQTASSPFAKKTKKQAWETDLPAQTPNPAPEPVRVPTPPAYQAPPAANSLQDSARRQIQSRQIQGQAAPSGTPYNYQPKPQSTYVRKNSHDSNSLAGGLPSAPPVSSDYYPGQETAGHYQAPYTQEQSQNYGRPQGGVPAAPYQTQASQGAYQGSNQGPFSAPHRVGWKEKLGLGHLKTTFQGVLRGGIAATEADGWRDDYIGEVKVDLGVSAITQGGLEYGVNLEARGQYDRYRRGFGGRVGDCPETNADCSSVTADGSLVPSPLRGHTSQFYTGGQDNVKEGEIALEGAYLFLRSAYGDVTLGRDDGAAYLFSLGAPTLLAVNASNSPLDYTGLDSVKTVNDASGFSEKITYTSPRLLGDQIGVGVQIGASYALNARACGVDYCVRRNGDDGSGALGPDLKDVLEVGLSLDRKFDNGLKVEATATYATANNDIALAAFDDLKA